jgi:hypothetical protein
VEGVWSECARLILLSVDADVVLFNLHSLVVAMITIASREI